MNTVPLGEVLRPARVTRAGENAYPLLSMTMHSGLVDQGDKFKKRVASDDLSGYKVIRRGQLVVGFPIDEAVLDFQMSYEAGIVSPAYGVWEIIDEDRWDRGFLQKFLRSRQAIAYYKAKLRGSTARRRSLPTEVFLALPVPAPNVSEQRRIAAMLDCAHGIAVSHQRLIANLDEIPQALYFERFGRQMFKPVELNDVVLSMTTGSSPKCAPRSAEAGEWGVLKLSAVTGGVYRQDENKAFIEAVATKRANEVRRGDILMTRKNTPDLVGDVAIVHDTRDRLLLPDLIFRIELNLNRLDPEFFQVMMMSPRVRAEVRSIAGGAAASMSNISKARFLALRLPIPPIDDQREFATVVREVRARRSLAARTQGCYDDLAASLQARAFRGEL